MCMYRKIIAFLLSTLLLLALMGCESGPDEKPAETSSNPPEVSSSAPAPSSSEAASVVPESSAVESGFEIPPLTSEAELANDTEVSMALYPDNGYTEVPEEIVSAALADAEKALDIWLSDGRARSGFFKDLTILQVSKDGNKFCYSARLVFDAVDVNDPSWYAGNTRFYEGEMEGYVSLHREFLMEKQDGEWVRLGFGTGGYRFEE